MQKLSTQIPRRGRALRVGFVVTVSLAPLFAVSGVGACNDTPGPATGPGDNLINDTNQDAVAVLTQDTGVTDVIVPMGIVGDGGYGMGTYLEGSASTGYSDVQSPQTACSSCTCGEKRGFCLENGVTPTVTAAPEAGVCALASPTSLAVGCNPLPDSCPVPSCACIINAIQPPLGCYPQCTDSEGFFDVYCNNP